MSLDKVTERLNAPRLFITNFSFPTNAPASLETRASGDTILAEDEGPIVPHATEKIHVQVSSEFSSLPRQFNLFGNAGPSEKESQRKLSLIHDLSGQPMIFSVSNTGELYCLCFVNGAGAGWQPFIVTPPCKSEGAVVDAFDTLEVGKKVHLVVSMECQSLEESDSMRQELWYATFDKPSLSIEEDGYSISGISNNFLEWKLFASGLSDRDVTSVLCSPSVKSKCGFHALIGTATRDTYAATHYIVDPTATEDAWKNLVMSGSADELLSMQPIVLGSKKHRQIGVVSAYRQTGGNTQQACSAEIFDEQSLERVLSYTLQAGKLGSVNHVYSSLNPGGLTDLVVAGTKGVGFFDSYAINELAAPPILPEISFKQVVCSENTKDDKSSVLAIFAISEHDELYFIQGCRSYDDDNLTFQASGLPIRTGVAIMSPQYNVQTNACEILYVTNEVNSGLRHLIRDPITSLWADGVVEFKLPVGTPAVLTREASYLTNIALSDSAGKGVPGDYPVTITASPAVHVTCNGRSLLLNHNPSTILTNEQGHIDLALPPDAGMSCSQLKLQLTKFPPDNGVAPTGCIEINPAQRIVNIMSTLNDKDAMQQAIGPDKKPVFVGDSIDDAEPLVTRFGIMAEHFSGDRLKDEDEKKEEARQKEAREKEAYRHAQEEYEKEAARKRDEELKYKERRAMIQMERKDGGNWFENVVQTIEDAVEDIIDTAAHIVGDLIECIKENVAKVTALVLKAAGPLLVMVVKVAGKMFSVEIPGIGPLLGAVFGVLKDILKATFPKLYAFLQLLFDGETTKRAQRVFHNLATSTMDHVESFIEANADCMAGCVDDFQQNMKSFIPDSRGQTSDPSTDQFLARASNLMNNPVVKILLDLNPMSWVLDGVNRGVSDSIDLNEIQMPSPGKKFDLAAVILAGVDPVIISRMFDTIISSLSSLVSKGIATTPADVKEVLLSSFGSLFHSLLETGKNILNKLWAALGGMISSMKDFLTGDWKIPGLTDLWEDLTGLNFSILNFVTYILAVVWKAVVLVPSLLFGDSNTNPMDIDHLLSEMEKMNLSSQPTVLLKSPQRSSIVEDDLDCEVLTMHTFHQEASLTPGETVTVAGLRLISRITRSIATFLEIQAMKVEGGSVKEESDKEESDKEESEKDDSDKEDSDKAEEESSLNENPERGHGNQPPGEIEMIPQNTADKLLATNFMKAPQNLGDLHGSGHSESSLDDNNPGREDGGDSSRRSIPKPEDINQHPLGEKGEDMEMKNNGGEGGKDEERPGKIGGEEREENRGENEGGKKVGNRRGGILPADGGLAEQERIKTAWNANFTKQLKGGIIGLNLLATGCGVAVTCMGWKGLSPTSRTLQICSVVGQGIGTLLSSVAFIREKMSNYWRRKTAAFGSVLQCIGSILRWASERDEKRSAPEDIFFFVDLGGAVSGFVASCMALGGFVNKFTIGLLWADILCSGGGGLCTFGITLGQVYPKEKETEKTET